jgi:hypothetical protein
MLDVGKSSTTVVSAGTGFGDDKKLNGSVTG